MPVTAEPGRPHREPEENPEHGRLSVRRGTAIVPGRAGTPGSGTTAGDPGAGDPGAAVFVPEPAGRDAYRLVVLLHGAGGSAGQGLGLMLPVAEQYGLILLAPQSVAATWDMISSGYGPDVRRLDRALAEVLASYPVADMFIGGFSDGASYALSLGMTNGDIFDGIVAFSPGFAAPMVSHGSPRIFVSHGDADRVLPIDRCSRRLVPRLSALGYRVTYDEFRGGHEVPDRIVVRAAGWLGER
ncbi:alpha/beta hydrolase [Actinoplanes teichomyceticus]|uniref:Putative esterase n=1 Tax=Actinoplanes teichomyceticus TaxID=1867 RepID=A0A561WBD7_ACTTI|nr:phospholipase [Actinoplanes teichomyceticus]TWG21169.1 putative esterase [Actinoplanes teichomyceticus]GIF14990.1 hypothetical protein Ate01nite_50220 [Actinoplanes teichomyceticus]